MGVFLLNLSVGIFLSVPLLIGGSVLLIPTIPTISAMSTPTATRTTTMHPIPMARPGFRKARNGMGQKQ